MFLFLALVVLATAALYYHLSQTMKYWKKRGVEQGNPKLIFGHLWEHFSGQRNQPEILHELYNQNPNARYTGYYRFSTPILMPRDPDLIKQICIKDFDHFSDHTEIIPSDADPLWAKNILNLNGSIWKDMRGYLTPTFTGSKMRAMFVLMNECAINLTKHLLDKKENLIKEEMRNLFSRYANDVIASAAFGVQVDSLAIPDNEFYKMGNEVASISSFWRLVKMSLYWFIPAIKNVIKVQLIQDHVGQYFREVINESVKMREENEVVRPDLLNILLDARKNARKMQEKGLAHDRITKIAAELQNEDITAHALIFFIAGFESVASFICFTTYELALNQDIQEKVREEIRDTLDNCDGKITYEAVQEMKYMDMVINESLRKWPHFIGIDRICTKTYTIHPTRPEEKPLVIEKDTSLTLPVYSIQRDPKYYPHPEKFDPERFSEENKKHLNSATYLSFGIGPRNCMGSRYSLLKGKIVLFHVLSHFKIVPIERTAIPLKFAKSTIFNLKPVDGFWLGLEKCPV